ncbi:MAG: theronine dehydrogenase [Ruminococcaceae bacterium]|nr:theronine dehydrogenase [Oscillospiraceae bacterium]MBQ2780788.1 alcohol dehydrogenase catalytic domain-containing protein [Clostridia bacterium]
MEVNSQQIESIVRELLAQMSNQDKASHGCKGDGSCGANCTCGKHNAKIPQTAKVAMLVKPKDIQVKEYPLPAIGDNDILVKVEGCGVCGTDVHEWKGDPFGMAPLVLGHEGTGTVVALGKNIKCDTAGKPLKVGDKLVTSVTNCGECYTCRMHPDTVNLCDKQGIFGLIPDSNEYHFNGWFAEYLVISREGATYFEVNDLDLKERMLLELACVCVHALERGQKTGLLNFNSKVLVQGCGPVGLMMIAVLRAAGINHIIAIDGAEKRLDMAKKLGAKTTISFKDMPDAAQRIAAVKEVANGVGVDFAYQCTGAPVAHAGIYDYIRRGGGLCEMGFFVNNGDCTVNPHFAYCNKEITLVGSWDYTAQDYPTTMAFLKQAREMNIPIKELITHTYPLDKLNEAMETNISQQGIKICYIAE